MWPYRLKKNSRLGIGMGRKVKAGVGVGRGMDVLGGGRAACGCTGSRKRQAESRFGRRGRAKEGICVGTGQHGCGKITS